MEIDDTTKWIIGGLFGGFGAVVFMLIGWVKNSSKEQIYEIKETMQRHKVELSDEIRDINNKLDVDQREQKETRHKHVNLITQNFNKINELDIRFTEFRASVKTTISQFGMMLKEGLRLISLDKKRKNDDL